VLLRRDAGRDLISDVASFSDFARLCQLLSQTSSRIQMAEAVGEFLASLDLDEAELAARFIVGRPLALGEEKKLHVSGRAIWKTIAAMTGGDDQGEEIFAAAEDFGEAVEMLLKLRPVEPEPILTIGEVATGFAAIAAIEGRSARARKLAALGELFGRATALEGKYLAKILIGEMRHGVSEGLMVEAIARMAGRPAAEVRRAHMLEGDLGRVVRTMRTGQAVTEPTHTAARALALKPIKPMLAEPVAEVADAFAILAGQLALEHKLDGARVQIHHAGAETRIFSRRLNEITASIPEIAEQARALGARNVILDGEVIAVDARGMPLAFQELMRRFSRQREIERVRGEFPIRLYLFDLLGLDGELCIDRPYTERTAALGEIAQAAGMETVGRIEPKTLVAGEEFYRDAIGAGYEGVVAKSLISKYTPGVRGRGWLKIKRARTLDLVIVAADWGYGRRKGWLSNYHLAARDEQSGEFSEVGKTFKGLSDEQFEAMTRRLLGLEVEQAHGTVIVRPAVVVEVAYSDLQRSRQYPAGMALRFARIVAVRDDKRPEEADTIQTIAREFERQPIKPAGRKPAGSTGER
jgi:ATP-dependent DNA ligase I